MMPGDSESVIVDLDQAPVNREPFISQPNFTMNAIGAVQAVT